MSLDPNRIRRDHDVWTVVALDTAPLLAERITTMLGHGRRITLCRRYLGHDKTPTVTTGLTVEDARIVDKPDEVRLGVQLGPGIYGFGFAAYSDRPTEVEALKVVRSEKPRDVTTVDINGGVHGVGRDDQIVIVHWNQYGVGEETIVAFDLGGATR